MKGDVAIEIINGEVEVFPRESIRKEQPDTGKEIKTGDKDEQIKNKNPRI